MKIPLRRTLRGWEPADAQAESDCKKYPQGCMVRADITRPRSYGHHKLIFALLDLTYRNLPERYSAIWPTAYAFRTGLADAIGHVETYYTKDGEIKTRPLRFSYDDLPDEAEFTDKSALAMAVCCELLGVDEPELAAEVSKYARFGEAA